ncbi:hypothetical protein ACVKXF_002909 [Curtobacterium sp. PvP017]
MKHDERMDLVWWRQGSFAIASSSVALGTSMTTAPASTWWGAASLLVVGGTLVCFVFLWGLRRCRDGSPVTLRVADWVSFAIGLGGGLLGGVLFFEGSAAFAALFPVPLVAIDSAVSRSGGGLRDRSIVLGLIAALIAVVLFWNADVRQGFSDLVQGSVVAGVLLAVGLVLRGVVRRQRA